jgi:hypothetical protein
MPDTNPPQERGAINSDHDQRLTIERLTALLHVAEGDFAARRRRALLIEFGREVDSDMDHDDDSGRRPSNEALMERLNNEARLRSSVNRARAARSLHDLAHGIRR